MSMQQLAASIPHVYRKKILLEWLPIATGDMANPAMLNLFNAYFIFVEPNGVKKSDCQQCVNNVLNNWKSLQPYLMEEEKNYETLEQLNFV